MIKTSTRLAVSAGDDALEVDLLPFDLDAHPAGDFLRHLDVVADQLAVGDEFEWRILALLPATSTPFFLTASESSGPWPR